MCPSASVEGSRGDLATSIIVSCVGGGGGGDDEKEGLKKAV